jgi:hypothetical protein
VGRWKSLEFLLREAELPLFRLFIGRGFFMDCKSDKKPFVTDIDENMEEASIAGDLKELNQQK